MAGAANALRAPYPNGNVTLMLGPVSIDGDTSGYKGFASLKAQYDFRVKKAYVVSREGSFTDADASMLLKILDDTSSPQTIVAETTLTTSYDTGLPIALTVADAGPILTGAHLILYLDAGPGDVLKDICVQLEVEPVRTRPTPTEG